MRSEAPAKQEKGYFEMEGMDEVLAFLTENHPFYVATVDGDTPKVRPFGFTMNYEGKLIFACNDQMNVYKQLKANPKFEIGTTNKSYQWIRLMGTANFITSRETKDAIVALAPNLKNLSPDIDGIVIFYAEDAEAIVYDIAKGGSRSFKL
jgi:uncharacterized pyridoxamine 5'-phosphate oxidase family protein